MKTMTSIVAGAVLAAGLAGAAASAHAAAGDIQLRLRGIAVAPSESSTIRGIGGEAEVSTSFAPELDVSYFFTDKLALELILATTRHEVEAEGTAIGDVDLGSTWVLPPTLTLQYHFWPEAEIRPYVGAGINYTVFWKENAPGFDIDYDDSFAVALQAGVDIPVNEDYFFNLDVKKIFLSTSVDVGNGAVTADVDLNPWVIGVGVGTRF